MALSHSPQTVTNGLVFYYDMGNPQKSWRGAPTTNLIATTPYTLTTYTACSGPVPTQSTNEFGQMSTVNRYTITGTGGTPRGRIFATGLTTGVNYSYSVKIRYNGPVGTQSWHLDSSKGNPEGGTNNNTFNSRTLTVTPLGNNWFQLVETFNFATCPTGNSMSNFGLSAPNSSYLNQTFDVYDLQFEQNSFATPFVNGTRSNTQAVLDLVGGNTVTANSLTYNANGQFSFNGSSNLATFPENAAFNSQAHSVEVWVRTNATTQNGFWFEKGNVNTQYSLFQEGTNIQWRHRYTDGALDSQSTTTATYLNTINWAQVVGTYGGGLKRTYINGALVNSRSESRTVSTNTNGCSIGVYGGFNGSRSYWYNGDIGLVKVYNKNLTELEVQQNFNALRGRYGI
jgi:hypothetical protein